MLDTLLGWKLRDEYTTLFMTLANQTRKGKDLDQGSRNEDG